MHSNSEIYAVLPFIVVIIVLQPMMSIAHHPVKMAKIESSEQQIPRFNQTNALNSTTTSLTTTTINTTTSTSSTSSTSTSSSTSSSTTSSSTSSSTISTTTVATTTIIPTNSISNSTTAPPSNSLNATSSTSSITTTTINTTTSTSSSTTSSLLPIQALPGVQKVRLKHLPGSVSTGTVLVNNTIVSVSANRSVLNSFNVGLKKNATSVNITVKNQSILPGIFVRPPSEFYQYIQINGTVNGATSDNIDQYVTNATYNFSVPATWLQQQRISSAQITLFKYYPSSRAWASLPTTQSGFNGTYYSYSSSSNSLSSYVVGFSATNTVTSAKVSNLDIGSSDVFQTYFFVVASNAVSGVSSCSFSTNFIIITSNEVCSTSGSSTGRHANVSVIGYNTVHYGNFIAPTGAAAYHSAFAGIGVNVIFGNNGVEVNTVSTAAATKNSITYSVNTHNSVVLLFYALAGNNINSIKLPTNGGCKIDELVNAPRFSSVAIANCITSATGSYTTSFLSNTATGVGFANVITAVVFPPYVTLLNDLPATGNILTNGTQQVSGNTIQVIGSNAVNAIVPSGGSFMGWFSDGFNTLNTIIDSPLTKNSPLTILGNAILTAAFWPNTFACNCLPYTIHTSSTNSITSSSSLVEVNPTSGFMTYFYAGAANTAAASGTASANFIVTSTASITLQDFGFIGYNTINTANIMTTGSSENAVLIGLGANVVFTNNGFTRNNIGLTDFSSNLIFTVNTPFSYVVLGAAVTNAVLNPSNYTLPSTCVIQDIGNTIIDGSAALATCNALPVGTYSVNVSLTNPGNILQQAWVFPPANIFLADNPGTGNILTNGTQQVNGNEITVIGDNAVNAIVPTGFRFTSWSADSANAANVSFDSSTSQNTFVSIAGDAILTATFTSTTSTCVPVLQNTIIAFPSTTPGKSVPSTNAEKVTDSGTSASNILVFGVNWISTGGNAFHVSNTLWNNVFGTGDIGTQLTNTAVDTLIPMSAGGSNNIFFGLNIPTGQAAGTYNQVITIEASC